MVYITSLAATKVSILFFYLKVFPGRGFRYCVYVLVGLNVCYAVAFDLLLAFQCNPIAGAWLIWDGTYHAKCISINLLGWSAAAINIVLDLAVIILPLRELFRLSMSIKKKVQIIMMFAVGLFVTFVSIIRLRSLVQFGKTQNVTRKCPACEELLAQVLMHSRGLRRGRLLVDYRGACRHHLCVYACGPLAVQSILSEGVCDKQKGIQLRIWQHFRTVRQAIFTTEARQQQTN